MVDEGVLVEVGVVVTGAPSGTNAGAEEDEGGG